MSEWFRNNMPMVIINTLLVIIMAIVSFNIRAAVKEISDKASKKELELLSIDVNENKQDINQTKIDSKEYVDSRFEQHTLTEQRAFNSLEKLMETYLDGQKSLIESIDSRLKRIEDKP